ncbi:MAG: pyridoxal-phosphate dependent enzyme [Bacteroidales bacterium]|jgi:threonine dehydratase|nr:pyridoxal-phosphate dependent enzyme [Bacteroidales bacterium]
MELFPDKNKISEAFSRVNNFIHRTPVLTSQNLNQLTGGSLFFKCENFQKTGSFKIRGAVNTVFSLSEDQLLNGVATHSSGNHAQALSYAARLRKIPAYIVMPHTSARPKVAAVQNYGGIIRFCEPNLVSREKTLGKVILETNAIEIHPYNNYSIIAGQATAALELIEDVKQKLDIIIAPVGGGGLLSGTALATNYFSPGTKVIAAEPENADDAFLSFKAGYIIPAPEKPSTIADGLLTSLGSLTFPVIKQYVNDIVTVNDEEIISAMKLIWERMKIIVEPSSAVPFAAILNGKIDVKGKNVGIILSGGNIDLQTIPWMR